MHSYFLRIIRRLIVELVEFFVAAQFVPLVLLLIWEAVNIFAYAMLLGGQKKFVDSVHMPLWTGSFDGFFKALVFFSIILYVISRCIKLINPTQQWWSVRRKAGISLTLITCGYMIFFVLLYATRPTTNIEPWILLCTLTVGAAVYGFGVRYVANKVLRRLQRFGIH